MVFFQSIFVILCSTHGSKFFLAFKDLYIQTNLHKFLKKLYKTMHFDLHA